MKPDSGGRPATDAAPITNNTPSTAGWATGGDGQEAIAPALGRDPLGEQEQRGGDERRVDEVVERRARSRARSAPTAISTVPIEASVK